MVDNCFNECLRNYQIDQHDLRDFKNSIKTQVLLWMKENCDNYDDSECTEEEIDQFVQLIIISSLLSPSDLRNAEFDFRFSFNNLRDWFSTIVSDRDWDWQYLIDIIEKKASIMRECFKSASAVCDEHRKDSRELRELISSCRGLKFAANDYVGKNYLANKDFALRRFRRAFNGLFNWWN